MATVSLLGHQMFNVRVQRSRSTDHSGNSPRPALNAVS